MPNGSNRSPRPSCSPTTRGCALAISVASRRPRGDSMLARMPMGVRDPSPGLVPGEHGGRSPHVLRGLRLGHVDHVDIRPGHGGHVVFEVRGPQSVHPHDEHLPARPSGRLLEECLQRPSRLDLSALLDRVLQVERDGVGFTGQRLVEELAPRCGHEQLAAHEEIHRAQPRAGPTTAPAPWSCSMSSSAKPTHRRISRECCPSSGAAMGAGAGPAPKRIGCAMPR